MTTAGILRTRLSGKSIYTVSLAMVYAVLATLVLKGYWVSDVPALAGIPILWSLLQIEKGNISRRYLSITVLAGCLAVCIPAKTSLFFFIFFALLLLIETNLGKVHYALVAGVFIVSPVFNYIATTLGFPIRLWLSNIVAQILSVSGMPARSDGNIIKTAGQEFSVDAACAGLYMMTISLLMILLFIGLFERRYKKKASSLFIIMLIILSVVLNLMGNILRILALVLFNVPSSSPMHDFIGILCWLSYVIVPLFLITRFVFHRFARTATLPGRRAHDNRLMNAFNLCCAAMVIYVVWQMGIKPVSTAVFYIPPEAKYKVGRVQGKVYKLESAKALIYLKATPFYSSHHDPKVCWAGSGYTFSVLHATTIEGIPVYTATMEHGHDKLYSAWWFESSRLRTTGQISWRWQSLINGETFYLVNISCASKQELSRQVSAWKKLNLIQRQ